MRKFAWIVLTSDLLVLSFVYIVFTGEAKASDARIWNGFYGGLNAGYGFSGGGDSSGGQTYYENTSHDSQDLEWYGTGGPSWDIPANLDGGIVGGQVGYNFAVSRFAVLGAETDFQWAGLSGDNSGSESTAILLYPLVDPTAPKPWALEGTGSVSQDVDWFGTLRARLGVTMFDDSLLVYGTGGLAYGRVRQTLNYSGEFLPDPTRGFVGSHWTGEASDSETKVGWTAGAGVEWLLPGMRNWSIKAEYLFTDLGSTKVDLTAPAFKNSGEGNRIVKATNTADAQWHSLRIGLNVHF